MRLSDQAKKTKKLVIDFGDGDILNVECRTRKITPALIASVARMGGGNVENILEVSENLVTLVASWDMEDDEGQPIALDPALLSNELDFFTQLEIIERIVDAARGTSPNRTAPARISSL